MAPVRLFSAGISLFASIVNFFRLRSLVMIARRVMIAGLIMLLVSNHTLAAPGYVMVGAELGQKAHLWWHASGWATKFDRLFPKRSGGQNPKGWDGKGAPDVPVPEPKPQETQEQRDARVVRVEIAPLDVTVAADEPVIFTAVAYDAKNSPVAGVQFDWEGEDEANGQRVETEKGKFSSSRPGNYRIKVKKTGREASAKVKVERARRAPGEKPIGTRVVSSQDLPVKTKSTSLLQRTKQRIARSGSNSLPGSSGVGSLATRGLAAPFAPTPSKIKTGSASSAPAMLPPGEDQYSWNSDNYSSSDDPGNERGNPPGRAPDGGAGSANFQFAAPVLASDGRGLDLNLGLALNTRLWSKAGSQITFDIDRDWPAPGWSLGFGKIVGMGAQNGFMMIEPDGTRHAYTGTLSFFTVDQECKCKTTDGSFIDYRVLGNLPTHPTAPGAPYSATAHLPNGTQIIYAWAAANAVYPSSIKDIHGNQILISYRNSQGPQIDKITDTLGRVIQFYYDSSNRLVGITGPGINGTTRDLVRLNYTDKNLGDLGANYGFTGLTPMVRSNSISVIKAIYYPANNTGYWFGDADSYSAYGMPVKIIEQRGMGFSGVSLSGQDPYQPVAQGIITSGTMTRQMSYDYPMSAGGLTDSPAYQNMTESWAGMEGAAPVTHYLVQESASPRRVEITRPDGVKTVMLSHNALGQFNDGLLYQTETYSPSAALLGKSFVNWAQGDCPPTGQPPGLHQYCAPRPSRIETTDERNQKTGKEFIYGTLFNQVTETRDFGYGYVFGGSNTLLRKTVNEYLNNTNYTDPQPLNELVWHHIFNLVTRSDVYSGSGTRVARAEYSYDQFTGTAGLQDTPGITGQGYDVNNSPYFNPNYNTYALDTRGNLTTVKRYADAAALNEATTIIEVRHYDVTGNVRQIDNSCCERTTVNYSTSTQYAWPDSQIRGSATDPTKQNTASATYDVGTGLVNTSTNANGRISQIVYDTDTLRPEWEYSPTNAYNYHIYDDAGMVVYDFAYEAGKSGADFASRSDKYLDGYGRVGGEIAYGKDYVMDFAQTKYDNLGRMSQQTRPFRGSETPQWTVYAYDDLDRVKQVTSPDGSVVKRFYNQKNEDGSIAPYPSAATQGASGQTVRAVDPWNRERWARFDEQNRLVEVVEPDPSGNGSVATGGMKTNYSFDTLGNLALVTQGSQTRSFKYDSLSRLTHQKLAERDATLNDAGAFVATRDQNQPIYSGGVWSDVFTYDNRSNLTQRVDARGVKMIFTYNNDPLNRLQTAQYDKSGVPAALLTDFPIPNAPTVTYNYMTSDDKNRLLNYMVSDGMGSETFSYDGEKRLSQVTETFTGREAYPLVKNYVWDSLDRIKELYYPVQYGVTGVAKKIEPAYDIASRLDSLKFGGTTFASNPVYNASSQTESLNIGSLMQETYSYDAKTGLLLNQQVKQGATTHLNLGYNYTLNNDPNNNGAKTGQLTGISDLKSGQQSRSKAYVYDKLGRLKEARGGSDPFNNPQWTQAYSYDRYGNRTGVTKSGPGAGSVPLDGLSSLTYTNGQGQTINNRITTDGFQYDPAGNQTRWQTETGTWMRARYDAAGRLAEARNDSDQPLETYSYGASNQRLKTEYLNGGGGPPTYYAWDGGQVIGEYAGPQGFSSLAWNKFYVYMGEQLLATLDSGGTKYHHPDRLGTKLVTDASTGAVTTEQTNLPYGTALSAESSGAITNRRFTSYDRSATTGMDYAVNRFYNAAQGRFTQVDPIGMGAASLGDPQSLNLYSYCGNDPINRLDPDGLFWGKLFGWIGRILKWIAIAAVVAIAVLTIIPATWAGTALGKIFVFLGKHRLLAGILGLGGVAGTVLTPSTFPGTSSGGVGAFLSGGDDVPKKTWWEWLTSDGLQTISNGAGGFGDTLSLGVTRKIRKKMGIDHEVDPCSGAYFIGEIAGTVHGVAMGGAAGARNALAVGGARGTTASRLATGARRIISDPRRFKTVSAQYWRYMGGARGNSLHHWAIPQRAGGPNAGWNLMEIPGRLNSWMNGYGFAPQAAEWGIRVAVPGAIAGGAARGAQWGIEREDWKADCGGK